MNKINVSALTETDLKALVTNAKQVFKGQFNADLGLNQARTQVARLFGAKSWQSLCAAVVKIPAVADTQPLKTYVGIRHVFGNKRDPETSFDEKYVGISEEAVYTDMANSFCVDYFDTHVVEYEFEDDSMIEPSLIALGIKGERIKTLATQIRAIDPDERHDIYHLFTAKEVVSIYASMWSEEERITVESIEHNQSARPISAPKPDGIQVIYYDLKGDMAIALQGGSLVGFYKLDGCEQPGHNDYDWDNGFDFDFIRPDQAEAIKRAGFVTSVEAFEARGAVCEA